MHFRIYESQQSHEWLTDQALSHPLLYSWWAMVSYGVLLVTLGAFIFGQTTANAIFVDLLA